MLFLYRNNRMELLLEALGDVLSEPRNDVLASEVIVVQSQGMERWLSMGLANRFGVWANGAHPFPRAFIEAIGDRLLGSLDAAQRFTSEAMAFHLACILGDLPNVRALAPLAQYLAERPGIEARLRLAEQLADAFDQVQVYRPDWCATWATGGDDEDFRPTLFRLLSQRLGGNYFPAQLARLVQCLEGEALDVSLLPERVCLFGVATLPPAFIHVFEALARHVPVHWFLLAASREYVGAERVRRELAHVSSETSFHGMTTDGALDDWWSPQPLLANFGRIMRDVGLLLEGDCHYVEGPGRDFVEPASPTVLATLQADLCALRRRGSSLDCPKLPLQSDDRSLEVHACHGPRRELEVLRELLLDAFERDRSLKPEDVIVLLRDVETYAPLVDAVFASESNRAGHVPYRLSDRHLGATNRVAEAAASLLETAQRRLNAAEFMHILELAPVAMRFEFGSDELATIRSWLRELGVTWGVDLEDRLHEGAAGQPEHTLRWGLSRILVGAAMDSDNAARYRGILPFDVEGDDAELAGRLAECAEKIFSWRERFAREQSLSEWHGCVAAALGDLFSVGAGEAWCLADLLQTLGALRVEAERAQFIEAVPAEFVARKIRNRYESNRSTQALLTGGVTFCAMLPMRGIPARIVAMVGLDDGCFPRSPSVSSFDDVARSPARPGDRVARDEDRHLFLETLLAARDRLIITYQGRNPRDDTVRPRSVVVDELLSVIDESFEWRSVTQGQPSQRIVIEHPLHAHSSRYFDASDPRLVVSDVRQYQAALALEKSRFRAEEGMQQALLPIELTEIEFADFERFWTAPAEYFYRVRLGAMPAPECLEPAVLDPTELDGLGRYQLTFEQWRALKDGQSGEDALSLWTARGRRPFANLGKVVHEEQLRITEQLYGVLTPLGANSTPPPRELGVEVGGVELRTVLLDIFAAGRVDWSPAKPSAKHRMLTWLRHLLLAASGAGMDSWLVRANIGGIYVERLPALDAPSALSHLEALLGLFRLGQRAPLAFFPEISLAYATRLEKGESAPVCLERALREYGDPLSVDDDCFFRPPGPREVLRLFGAEPPLSDSWPRRFGIPEFPSFTQVSRAMFLPYLERVSSVDAEHLATAGVVEPALSEGSR